MQLHPILKNATTFIISILLLVVLGGASHAESPYDLKVRFIDQAGGKSDEVPMLATVHSKTPVFDENGYLQEASGWLGNAFLYIDFKESYEIDFSTKVKVKDRYVIAIAAPVEDFKFIYFYADGSSSEKLNTDQSKWFTVGKEHAIAFNVDEKYNYKVNKDVTKAMEKVYATQKAQTAKYKVKVRMNGQPVVLSATPIVKSGVCYLPVRDTVALFDRITQSMKPETIKAHGVSAKEMIEIYRHVPYSDTRLFFTPGQKGAYEIPGSIGSKMGKTSDSLAFYEKGILYAPVDDIAGLEFYAVKWDAKKNTLDMTKRK